MVNSSSTVPTRFSGRVTHLREMADGLQSTQSVQGLNPHSTAHDLS